MAQRREHSPISSVCRSCPLAVLDPDTDRDGYLAPARTCASHVFLDPDTGVTLKKIKAPEAPKYLLGDELVAIVQARPEWLTLVFDQSVARGKERAQLEEKLAGSCCSACPWMGVRVSRLLPPSWV